MGAASPLIMIVLMFVVFYFIVIRPQVKRQQAHQEMLSKLTKGEMVVTRGGIVGKIYRATEKELTLDLGGNVRVKVPRAYVDGRYTESGEVEDSDKAA